MAIKPVFEPTQIYEILAAELYKIEETDRLSPDQQNLDDMIRARRHGLYIQCECIAHKELTQGKPVNYKLWLRQLLSSTVVGVSINYVILSGFHTDDHLLAV